MPPNIPRTRSDILKVLARCVDTHWGNERQKDLEAVPNRMVVESVDAEIAAIDRTLDNLEGFLHGLRQDLCFYRNMKCPVNGLPDEVITSIFLHIGDHPRDKVNITHTCSRWRDIALKFSSMWTNLNLDFVEPHNFGTLLSRSKFQPLVLRCSTLKGVTQFMLGAALPRVVELHVRCNFDGMESFPTWLCYSKAPELINLTIDAQIPFEYLLPNIFSGDRPRLQELRLINTRMAFSPGLYSHLRRLNITFSDGDIDIDDGAEDILNVFKDSPGLEQVDLSGDFYSDPDAPLSRFDMMDLPKLHTLILDMGGQSLQRIISHITAPSLRNLHLTVQACDDVATFTLITSPYPLLSTLFQSFQCLIIDSEYCTVHGFSDFDQRDLIFAYDDLNVDSPSTLSDLIVTFFPLPNLQRLQILRPFDTGDLMLLSHAPTIVRLDIRNYNPSLQDIQTTWLLKDMAEEHHKAASCRPNDPFLPELHTLSLDCVFLDTEVMDDLYTLGQCLPKLKHLQLRRCASVLAREEAIITLLEVYRTVDWLDDPEPEMFMTQDSIY
ncbi:hypothetical protein C8Q75DRAFT_811868 [Abortiporus biennis]|nr:hypothetical protein C8Q75DRAFT_811868 [Abortiporus biennis]